MKYKTIIKLKKPKTVIKLKLNFLESRMKKVKTSFKIPKEIITKLKILEKIEGNYFSDSLIKTIRGEYFN